MAGGDGTAETPFPLKGLRLAMPAGYLFDGLDDAVATSFDEAVQRLSAAGAIISKISLATLEELRRILVLEFGGSDIGPLVQMPAALSYPMNMPRYDWGYVAEPDEGHRLRRQQCSWDCLRGVVLRGCRD